MKKITIALVLFLTFGMLLTSCENTTKGAKKDAQEMGTEIKKEVKKDAKKVEAAVEKGVEKTKDALAMNDYQCPMKCEGEKVYHEHGKCPKCKMDLKKLDTEHKH